MPGDILRLALRTHPPISLYLCLKDGHFQLKTHCDQPPDATLRGTPLTLLRLLLNEHPTTFFQQGLVEIEGDVHVLSHFKHAMALEKLEDWLANHIGDTPAYHLTRTLHLLHEQGRSVIHALSDNIGEYLQEEICILPSALEIEDFCRDVSTLRDDAERLKLRFYTVEDGGLRTAPLC